LRPFPARDPGGTNAVEDHGAGLVVYLETLSVSKMEDVGKVPQSQRLLLDFPPPMSFRKPGEKHYALARFGPPPGPKCSRFGLEIELFFREHTLIPAGLPIRIG
jgi:hypothetical protein